MTCWAIRQSIPTVWKTVAVARMYQPVVSDTRWKTSLLDVHISGRIVFFKAISKDQHEVRSAFKPVQSDLRVQDAVAMLDAAAAP